MLNFSEHFPVQTTITFSVVKKSARPHYSKSHLMGIHNVTPFQVINAGWKVTWHLKNKYLEVLEILNDNTLSHTPIQYLCTIIKYS